MAQNSTIQLPSAIVLKSERARRSHLHFIDFMWQRKDPFVIGNHIEIICDKIDEAFKNFEKEISSYLLFKVPFRHTKSDISSRYLPANFIGKYPDKEVIVTGYAADLVEGFSRDCQNIVKDPRFQHVYPGVHISKEKSSVKHWRIQNRYGKLYWIGLGGPASGKGAELVVVDDLFKGHKEAESEQVRDSTWASLVNDIITRRGPVTIFIVLATPRHVDDQFGRIKELENSDPNFPKFEEIKLPSFDKSYKQGILFPERYSLDWYISMKAFLGEYAFAALMQCDPTIRGGNMFKVDCIKYYTGNAPEGLRWCRGWDPASTEEERASEDPDYTRGALVGLKWKIMGGGVPVPVIYVDDIKGGRWAAPERDAIIEKTTLEDGERVSTALEAYGPYKDTYEHIQKKLRGIKVIIKMQLPGDKVVKASVLEAPIEAGNFYVRGDAPWKETFVKEFTEFPSGKHDDIVDAVVIGYEGHNPDKKRVWPEFENKHIIKFSVDLNKTIKDPDGSMHYAGLWQKKDLTVWVVLALWDAYKGILLIYDAFALENNTKLIDTMKDKMQLKKYKCHGIICNSLNWENSTKNIGLQYRREFNTKGLEEVRVRQAFDYDEYASISEISQLFSLNLIIVSDKAYSLALQMFGWNIVDRGKQMGGRPDEENDGFCRALCLIVSDLRKKDKWERIVKPKLADYNRSEFVDRVYNEKVQEEK